MVYAFIIKEILPRKSFFLSLCLSLFPLHTLKSIEGEKNYASNSINFSRHENFWVDETKSFFSYQIVSLKSHLGQDISLKRSYQSLSYSFLQSVENNLYYGIDLRSHYLGHSFWGTNTGIVMRSAQIFSGKVFGANFFYDRLDERKSHQQLGVGIELLGKAYDLRANGYIPLQSTKSETLKHKIFNYPGGYIAECRQKQSLLKGADLEIGKRISVFRDLLVYFALGTYGYKEHTQNKNLVGCRLRAAVNWSFVDLKVQITHDRYNHTLAQAILNFSYKFTNFFHLSVEKKSWHFQPIYRQELIVKSSKRCLWRTNY